MTFSFFHAWLWFGLIWQKWRTVFFEGGRPGNDIFCLFISQFLETNAETRWTWFNSIKLNCPLRGGDINRHTWCRILLFRKVDTGYFRRTNRRVADITSYTCTIVLHRFYNEIILEVNWNLRQFSFPQSAYLHTLQASRSRTLNHMAIHSGSFCCRAKYRTYYHQIKPLDDGPGARTSFCFPLYALFSLSIPFFYCSHATLLK